MKRHGSAAWQGALRDGKGAISTESGALKEYPYGFGSRFEGKPGTNPEELIGAAHAETCLTDYSREAIGLYAVYPSTRNLSAKVRVFIDLRIERFGDDPFWDRAIFRDGE